MCFYPINWECMTGLTSMAMTMEMTNNGQNLSVAQCISVQLSQADSSSDVHKKLNYPKNDNISSATDVNICWSIFIPFSFRIQHFYVWELALTYIWPCSIWFGTAPGGRVWQTNGCKGDIFIYVARSPRIKSTFLPSIRCRH